MGYNDYLRRKLLAEALSKMTDEERRAYEEDKRHKEVMSALQQQHADINAIGKHVGRQTWWTDFASDIAANFTTDGLIWLGSKLFRKL